MAYVIRASNRFKKRNVPKNPLEVREVLLSQEFIVRHIQLSSFEKGIDDLKNQKELSNKNLLCFKPFLDDNGIREWEGDILDLICLTIKSTRYCCPLKTMLSR